jgi:phosphoribosylglycinamide formyltransferase 1
VTVRIAVFASGTGSNLEALLRYFGSPAPPRSPRAIIALVVSNRASAGALAIGAHHGVPTSLLSDPADGRAVLALLSAHRIDLVALAGYLKTVPADVTKAFGGRMVNVHPALLPAFGGAGMYGARVHQAVIDAGVRLSGVTVHFVDAIYDHGPIIAQWPVPVWADDTAAVLAARVLAVEHVLYPRAVEAIADGRVRLDARGRVVGNVQDVPPQAAFSLLAAGDTTCP